MTDRLELLYNIMYIGTDGEEGVKTLPDDVIDHELKCIPTKLERAAIRKEILERINLGFTPAPFLKPSDGIAIRI